MNPRSPVGSVLLYVVSSPARYMKKQIRPGGIKSSIFSLIILCLGAGTITIPYVFSANGIIFGTILILFGAGISFYTGWLVVLACHKLNAGRYEDIAVATYGPRMKTATSICMLLCLIGFAVSYVVLVLKILKKSNSLYSSKNSCLTHLNSYLEKTNYPHFLIIQQVGAKYSGLLSFV